MVRRIYVEKKNPYAVFAKERKAELRDYLDLKGLTSLRVLIRYDVEEVSETTYHKALSTVFSEPPVDACYEESFPKSPEERVFSVEYLPGQFDQRADSACQCLRLLNEKENPVIRSATTYVLSGDFSENQWEQVKAYCINPVDSREAKEEKPETLAAIYQEPDAIPLLEGFTKAEDTKRNAIYDSLNLAMTPADFSHIQNYFREEEHRDPTMTEIRVLDTYWSDHCRHTTFLTELKSVEVEPGEYAGRFSSTFATYQRDHEKRYKGQKGRYLSLMDLALMGMKELRDAGKLQDMEVSDEINACSIILPVTVDGKEEEWLIFFKNETHNHPTEIEPFGGAATCLGGAIRDPLSGRGYVYQAMRVTGAADPTKALKDTMEGKLPQRKITTGAAEGYSSYGNQIGLATGLVREVYHPNFVAKRMEIGAVMGAAPRKNVIREDSDPGDIIILLGGRTGRDGCGGATGSSKAHTTSSIETCGAEVQKGNAPTERKIQRLFRKPEVTKLIKKCNDFGAGGVSVAIGELADGLKIYLDRVPKKYAGLDGTELAISESQERMAVVVSPEDVEKMLEYAAGENLEAVIAAEVTKEPRLKMYWKDQVIVDLSREFLNTNGAHQEARALITMPKSQERKKAFTAPCQGKTEKEQWLSLLSDLNICSQRGLGEMFDSSIGAGTVVMPYGGKYQQTPNQTMVAKLPLLEGNTSTVTFMSYGYDPYVSSWSPYHGAAYAILSSVAKVVASGGDPRKIRFTFQEYFRRMTEEKEGWGVPLASLLGAYEAQLKLGLPSIGGKDSMSGTFNEISVPPTLVSFAVDTGTCETVVTPELKKAGHKLILFSQKLGEDFLPAYEEMMDQYDAIYRLMKEHRFAGAYALEAGGILEAVTKMAFGNKLGVTLETKKPFSALLTKEYGSILAEVSEEALGQMTIPYEIVGTIVEEPVLSYGETNLSLEEAYQAWTAPLEKIYPTKVPEEEKAPILSYQEKEILVAKEKVARPKVFIPVFPGTNCEYDSARAFRRAGAETQTVVFRNQNENDILDSVEAFVKGISTSQMIFFPGGFSAGDEPDGSGKFIATAFRNEKLKEAVMELLHKRDGLALGICNGFQALIKLGLLPYGEIPDHMPEDAPTLTRNTIGRHVSRMVYTKVVSQLSPWLHLAKKDTIYAIPASHGEGRFVANETWLQGLAAKGMIATQYVDASGNPTMDTDYNPNGSFYAIEGITNEDGRVLGKMAHSERRDLGVGQNIWGEKDQKIFESGVKYFQ